MTWNRMSSGTYFPPPVKAVEIPKPHGGTRVLGCPPSADRVAQTVVAIYWAKGRNLLFHPDSYGYRPAKSALDAVATCRRRCWEYDWADRLGRPEVLRLRAVGPSDKSGGGCHRLPPGCCST